MRYAQVIVDISLGRLDRTYTYRIPEALQDQIEIGTPVRVSFGRRDLHGYVIGLSDESDYDPQKIKEIQAVDEKGVALEDQLIRLAVWMRDTYGCTMNQALKTVLPARRKVKSRKTAESAMPFSGEVPTGKTVLNEEQMRAADGIWQEVNSDHPRPCLLFGITGSGKTEVYMELIERTIAAGKQAILLIPEISLTFQNLERFYRRFGDRTAVLHSRLSAGEKYDNLERVRTGQADLMIGPRSALFAPFPRLGMILVDEEHDGAYHSDYTPRYRAGETAIERGRLAGAGVVLGSATPSMESFYAAMDRRYAIFTLRKRAVSGSRLPRVDIIDLREELREGNKTIFSRKLEEEIRDRLEKGEQVMLFLNRRGYAGFLSCRSCGRVIKCPHCDVSLTSHAGGELVCHYCGYRIPMPDRCPSCGSPYIAGFGTGTQKVESLARKYFPHARILRMDTDTTARKGSHGKILGTFREGKADILIGTQMIVKGHDFPRVTLVGILAADLSLYTDDFRSAERTFQLLTQAAGRAGRAGREGHVIIQTYTPENYAIRTAAEQDYIGFYKQEIRYRQLMHYPPAGGMLKVMMMDPSEEEAEREAAAAADQIRREFAEDEPVIIGPAEAGIARVQDMYRQVLYVKHPDSAVLRAIRDRIGTGDEGRCQLELL